MSPATVRDDEAPAVEPPTLALAGERLGYAQALYGVASSRRELLELHASWPLAPRRIRVHRNHAVELALSVTRPYLELAGIAPVWELRDYDDSLAFDGVGSDAPADVELVWLDHARFAAAMDATAFAAWLAGRLTALRARSDAPILLLDSDDPQRPLPAGFVLPPGGGLVAERSALVEVPGYLDPERAALTGTRMSAAGALATARALGGRWLPALLAPRVRAIVVDLDETLYAGVLGEDGPGGVTLTEGHRALQDALRARHADGLFLGLVSRNEPADVEALFAARREEFPLAFDDFDAVQIGWEAKSAALARVADALRIDPATIVYVDDNPGELLEVGRALPGVGLLPALPDAELTARGLADWPGVFVAERSEADTLRAADLRANHAREAALADAGEDLGAYLRELGVTLTVGHDRAGDRARVAELSGKTNQFNLALARLSAADLDARAADPAVGIATARLTDRLTDSGLIAFAVARRAGARLVVEDLCVSCRALGRRLEDLIVAAMLVALPGFDGAAGVEFVVRDGPRNAPAREWLAAFAGAGALVPAAQVAAAAESSDVRIEVLGE